MLVSLGVQLFGALKFLNTMSLSKKRSLNYFRQLKGSVLYKAGAIASTFLAMPIMIKYLGAEQFGVWATMLTLVTWVMLFDFGIGNGLKNKVSESLAQDKPQQAASYISTAYGLIGVVSFLLFSLFVFFSAWLPWQRIFNTHIISEEKLEQSVVVLSFFIFFNFWISLISQVCHGLQKSSIVVLGQFISNAAALFFVFLLYRFFEPSIINIVLAYGASLVLANSLLSFFVFKAYPVLRPKAALFGKIEFRPLLSIGFKFFIIQLAMLAIFMADKFLITQLLGPKYVTPYEVLFKLFSVFTILHGMILMPLWPAYTDAYSRGDFAWIRVAMGRQIKIAFVLFFGAFLLAIVGPSIVSLWIGDEVNASSGLYFLLALFVALSMWSNVFAYFVNAINKLDVQLYTAVIAAVINVPMAIYFVDTLNFGLEGVVLASIVSLSIYGLVGPLQVLKIIKFKGE